MCCPHVPGYSFVNKIGSGATAVVYKAQTMALSNTPKFVAIKCFKRKSISEKAIDSICSEIKILKVLNHPNIIKMIDFLWDKNFVYIIMEYCNGGDLHSYLKSKKSIPEEECALIFYHIIEAMKYLRELQVSHMDLKPHNILLTSDKPLQLKITDFGLAQIMIASETKNGIRGSPIYMAPEILSHQNYDAKADLWSLGIILYECLFGYMPFQGTLEQIVRDITSKVELQISSEKYLSENCKQLLGSLLQKDPSKRISFDDLINHPFISLRSKPMPINLPDTLSSKKSELLATPQKEHDSSKKDNYVSLSRPKAIKSGVMSEGCSTASELYTLSFSTPKMKQALEMGLEAIDFDHEERIIEAYQRYESAIDKLLKVSEMEPKGRRRTLLQSQIELWISRAEELKELIRKSH